MEPPLESPGEGVTRLRDSLNLIDIDERRRAEEALAARERNLKLIIDMIPALAGRRSPMEAPSSSTSIIWTSSAFRRGGQAVGVGQLPF